jgi:hypothetical protein
MIWQYFILTSVLNFPFNVNKMCGDELVRVKATPLAAVYVAEERACSTDQKTWVEGFRVTRETLTERYQPFSDPSLPKE